MAITQCHYAMEERLRAVVFRVGYCEIKDERVDDAPASPTQSTAGVVMPPKHNAMAGPNNGMRCAWPLKPNRMQSVLELKKNR